MTPGLVHVTTLDKNVKKNGSYDKALESIGNYKILPPSPQKNNVEVWLIISDLDLTTLTRVGRGNGP